MLANLLYKYTFKEFILYCFKFYLKPVTATGYLGRISVLRQYIFTYLVYVQLCEPLKQILRTPRFGSDEVQFKIYLLNIYCAPDTLVGTMYRKMNKK